MTTKVLLCGVLCGTLSAWSDADMDGVEDALDGCANTPFFELVDARGCTTQSVKQEATVRVSGGVIAYDTSYYTNESVTNLTTLLELSYETKDMTLWLSTGHFQTPSASGMEDSYLGISFAPFVRETLFVTPSFALVLPTYKSDEGGEAVDVYASVMAEYMQENHTLFGSLFYTRINDASTATTQYQDRIGGSVGVYRGLTPKLNATLLYSHATSMFQGTGDIATLGIKGAYTLDAHNVLSFGYARGLTDDASQNTFSAFLDYTF